MSTRINSGWRKYLALLVVALVVLPIMAVMASWAYAALSALPDVRFTGQQIDALAWLPVLSLYAGAAVVLAVFFNNVFCWEPGRHIEQDWHDLAKAGNPHAKWLLVRNDIRWLLLLILSGAFFWMAR